MQLRSIRRTAATIHFFLVAGSMSGATAAAQTAPDADTSKSTRPNSEASTRSWRPTIGRSLPGLTRQAAPTATRPARSTAASAVNATSESPTSSTTSTAQSSAPQTTIVAPRADPGDRDYWIVSSRDCGGIGGSSDASRCLVFLHRVSDHNLVRERREAFLASIRPDRPVCFVAHGSYNRWSDVINESRRIHTWLRSAAPDSPLQVVFFTWPSDGNMPFIFPVDIAILGRRSAAHGAYLASLVSQLPAEQQVAILGHSHGARTAVAALHVLGGGGLEEGPSLPAGWTAPRQIRAVLIAAAIDHNWLNPGQRYGQALLVPERVLLVRNSRDATLAIYPMRKLLGERALGKDGLGQDDRLALASLGPKVVELNAAEFADWHHSFADFHQRPELAAALLPYVYFQETALSPGGAPIPATAAPSIAPQEDSLPPAIPSEAESGNDSSSEKQQADESAD